MKKTTVILGFVSIMTLCLTACGKPSMSFEETIDSMSHSEINEMMAKADNYEQDFNISSKFSITENNVEANVYLSTNTKQNVKDSEWESKISVKIDASWDWEDWREYVKLNWDVIIRYLPRGIYFKLNSLDIEWPEELNFDSLNLEWIKDKWFSFEITEEMLDKMKAKLPEDFDLNELYNQENLQKLEENLKILEKDLKKAINNEGSLIYNGKYSEFNWYNARKFSVNKEKVFEAVMQYIKTLIPEENMDEYMESLEELDVNEVFENFPIKNFEWYLIVTWKDNVQIIIENLDIEDEFSTIKIHGTFGKGGYELVINSDGEDMFILSAKLKRAHYDVILKVADMEILKWVITPKKSSWKFSIDYDLSVNFELDEKINIPLKWSRNWKEISKFNVEKPSNSQNLLESIMGDMVENLDPSSYQLLANGMGNQSFATPVVAVWILAASLTPRMQSAQNRARDVARKSDLSQIQTAIITSQQDNWAWPGMNSWATKWIPISTIEKDLMRAWMYSVPTDPNYSNTNYWLWENYENESVKWDYLYLVAKRNWVNNGGFVLMAKTEVEWSSNRVVCKGKEWLKNGYINNNTDLAKVKLCRNLTKWDTCSSNWDECTYTDQDELRYIIMY